MHTINLNIKHQPLKITMIVSQIWNLSYQKKYLKGLQLREITDIDKSLANLDATHFYYDNLLMINMKAINKLEGAMASVDGTSIEYET